MIFTVHQFWQINALHHKKWDTNYFIFERNYLEVINKKENDRQKKVWKITLFFFCLFNFRECSV